MTHQIWKYELNSVLSKLRMPVGSHVLSVQVQRDTICLWARVDIDAPKIDRTFELVGTGQPMHEGPATYIDTVLLADGYLAFHIFERHS